METEGRLPLETRLPFFSANGTERHATRRRERDVGSTRPLEADRVRRTSFVRGDRKRGSDRNGCVEDRLPGPVRRRLQLSFVHAKGRDPDASIESFFVRARDSFSREKIKSIRRFVASFLRRRREIRTRPILSLSPSKKRSDGALGTAEAKKKKNSLEGHPP